MGSILPSTGKSKSLKRSGWLMLAAHYLREVGRRKQMGQEPNDRGRDRRLEQKLKRMAPEEVDALFRGETE